MTAPTLPTRLRQLAAELRARLKSGRPLGGTAVFEALTKDETITVGHMRATRFFSDGTPDPTSFRPVDPATNKVIP